MPNHINNKLTILGPDEAVRAFVAQAHGCAPRSLPTSSDLEEWAHSHPGEPYPKEHGPDHLQFHCIVPLPAEYAERDYDSFGFQAERDAWGVKWGAYDQSPPTVREGRADYAFQTAWALPDLWVRRASEAWPQLRFICSAGGEGPYRARVVYAAGTDLDRRFDAWKDPAKIEAPETSSDDDEDAWFEERLAIRERLLREHDDYVERWSR